MQSNFVAFPPEIAEIIKPNCTPLHDAFLDRIVPLIRPVSMMTMTVIYRNTLGEQHKLYLDGEWKLCHQEWAYLSYTDFRRWMLRVKTDNPIRKAIRELSLMNLIIIRREGSNKTPGYKVNELEIAKYDDISYTPTKLEIFDLPKVSWRKIRKERIDFDGGSCVLCGATDKLHVHHLTYEREGREKREDLITLCASCHSKERVGKGQSSGLQE